MASNNNRKNEYDHFGLFYSLYLAKKLYCFFYHDIIGYIFIFGFDLLLKKNVKKEKLDKNV